MQFLNIFVPFFLSFSFVLTQKNNYSDVLIPCVTDADCLEDMPGSRCKNDACICESQSCTPKIPSEMVMKIGEKCKKFSECSVNDSYCNMDGVCDCRDGFVTSQNGKACLEVVLNLGSVCVENEQCSNISGSACLLGTCSCKEQMHVVGNRCFFFKALGEICTDHEECAHVEFGKCSEGQCACEKRYVSGSKHCLLSAKTIMSPCTEGVQCTTTLGETSLCREGFCACADSYQHKPAINKCVSELRLGDECSKNEDCNLEGDAEKLQCLNSVCLCKYELTDGKCTYNSSHKVLLSPTIIVFVLLAILF